MDDVIYRPETAPTGGPMFDRERPYEGQPHTDHGERGKVELFPINLSQLVYRDDRDLKPHHITMRDIYDATLIGILHAKNREDSVTGRTLPLDEIMTHEQLWRELGKDPGFDEVAAAQNASVEIEKRLGIYPNVAQTVTVDAD